jgi:hypothetical protein
VPEKTVDVSFRPGAPGVLNLRKTGEDFLGIAATKMNADGKLDSAEFALQMIRFPYRQVFGDPNSPNAASKADVFRPSLKFNLSALLQSFTERLS